jgi:RNA polymerase sigma-70 factor, ECF subfamily
MRFLAKHAFVTAGDVVMIPTAAHAQAALPSTCAVPTTLCGPATHVVTAGAAAVPAFLDPHVFCRFGLPETR